MVRQVECVWRHTGDQAGENCRAKDMPAESGSCTAKPCKQSKQKGK